MLLRVRSGQKNRLVRKAGGPKICVHSAFSLQIGD